MLHQQLQPGELDAVVRVCRCWATQLTRDVTELPISLPPSFELVLQLLERLERRYKSVHGYRIWLPAGREWANLDELLWLFSRYKAERLILDGCYSLQGGSSALIDPAKGLSSRVPEVEASGGCQAGLVCGAAG